MVRPLRVVFKNNFGVPVVAFFRGKFPQHTTDQILPVICDTETCTKHPDPNPECTPGMNNSEFAGVDMEASGGVRTFYLKIPKDGAFIFYIDASKMLTSTTTWVVPEAFANHMRSTIAKGPDRVSTFEMTNEDSPGLKKPHVGFNVSYLEGVSCAIYAEFFNNWNSSPDPVAVGTKSIPNPNGRASSAARSSDQLLKPEELSKSSNPAEMFYTILSDKHTASINTKNDQFDGLTSRALAACPGGPAPIVGNGAPMGKGNSGYNYTSDRATGMHLCRAYYYDLNEEDQYDPITHKPRVGYKRTYCNWLRANNVNAFCWAYDELTCTGRGCGYGGGSTVFPDRPQVDFSRPLPGELLMNLDAWASNYTFDDINPNQSIAFSCGSQTRNAPGLSSSSDPELAGENDGFGNYMFWTTTNGFGCKTNKYIANPYTEIPWPADDVETAAGTSPELTITFNRLDWLNPIPTTPKPQQNNTTTETMRTVVSATAVAAAMIAAASFTPMLVNNTFSKALL